MFWCSYSCVHGSYEVLVEKFLCNRELTCSHCHQLDVAIVAVRFKVIDVRRQAEQHLPCLFRDNVVFLHCQKVHACQNSLGYLPVAELLENLALVLVASVPTSLLASLLLVNNPRRTITRAYVPY